MKINIPKGNKFLYLDIFSRFGNKNKINIWENEVLLPRNSKLKLVNRYDYIMNKKKPGLYLVNNILHNKVKHENIPTRVYEFDYIGYEDPKQKIEFDVFLEFNKNKTYLKEIEKQVEDEYKNTNKIAKQVEDEKKQIKLKNKKKIDIKKNINKK
jgi:hypothetical protein